MWEELLRQIKNGDAKALSRSISLVENEYPGYETFLESLPPDSTKIIGITGPPGAGKSTIVDALLDLMVDSGRKIGVLCIDPSSPFNLGALLGDRIRMSDWYTHQKVFIRSLASRGTMGGLHPKIIEITEVMKAFSFDDIIIETVGVGQSEIEITGLADVTVVVVVPEGGDEVQTMKAGLMEIADVFVVNKADRPDADMFVKNLQLMLAPTFSTHYNEVPVIKTIATQSAGISELFEIILHQLLKAHISDKKFWFLTEKAFQIIQKKRMKDINKAVLKKELEESYLSGNFNLYKFISDK